MPWLTYGRGALVNLRSGRLGALVDLRSGGLGGGTNALLIAVPLLS